MSEDLSLYVSAVGSRGLAEKIRILLAETGLASKCPEIVVDQAGLDKMSADKYLNWDSLPVLKHGSKLIEDSANIMEYIAEYADKLGKGPSGNLYTGAADEKALVRAVSNKATEFQILGKTWFGKEKSDPEFAKVIVPKWFALFQRVLDKNDDGDVRTTEWTIGKHFTYGDIAVFEAVNSVVEVHGSSSLRAFPKLKEFHDKVAGRARVDHYLSGRKPQTFA